MRLPKKLGNRNLKRCCHHFEFIYTCVAKSPFNLAEIRPIDRGGASQILLRDTTFLSQSAKVRC